MAKCMPTIDFSFFFSHDDYFLIAF